MKQDTKQTIPQTEAQIRKFWKDDKTICDAIITLKDYIKSQTLCYAILQDKIIKPKTTFLECKIGIKIVIFN